VLNNGLVWYSKCTTRRIAPVRRVQSNRGLLERLASAAERQEAFGVQVWKHDDQDVERELSKVGDSVSHGTVLDKLWCRMDACRLWIGMFTSSQPLCR
jgi:hypothetical protein